MPTSKSPRDDFPQTTVRKIAQEAMFVCANDHCLRFTGYSTTEGKVRRIADAAHIAPASSKGPGAGRRTTNAARSDVSNGVWLCKICHKKVDDDPLEYPAELLRRWKNDHANVIRRIVGKDIEAALLELRTVKRHHEEMREVLSFFDSKRVFYEGLDQEFPPHVLASIELIRERITTVRARVAPDSQLFVVLGKLQEASKHFLRAIGKDTDLNTLRCDGTDPRYLKFAEELKRFRREMNLLLTPLAQATGYSLQWLPDQNASTEP